MDPQSAHIELMRKSKRQAKKSAEIGRILVKEEVKARVKQVSVILKKTEETRSQEEKQILLQSPEIVQSIDKKAKVRDVAKQRLLEVEDDLDILESKCAELAEALRTCKNAVVFTGAGISTAASIPDYRGPNGVWTLLQQGKEIVAQELSEAEPTLTHMAIAKLHHENIVKYVVSQNCDGLHLRSGLSRKSLSEVHGNMFLEVCRDCKAHREYFRLFDVTERTGVRRHTTGRMCHGCGASLKDTIVHFGEKGGLHCPYNWQEAADAVDDCDLILCVGSSLKILRKYPCLWSMDLRPKDRPKLYIVNLQWTPKDDLALLKINGKCDQVLCNVMKKLSLDIPHYNRSADPLFKIATALLPEELNTTTKKILEIPRVIEPDLFSHAAKSLQRLKKSNKKKFSKIDISKPEEPVVEKGVNSELLNGSVDSQGSVCNTSPDNATIITTEHKSNGCLQETVHKPSNPIKTNHPLLCSKLGFNSNLGSPSTDVITSPTFVKEIHTAINHDLKTVHANQVSIKEESIVNGNDLDGHKVLMKTVSVCQGTTSINNSTPTSPGTSLPGWFGKGINPRKRKRKL